MSDLTLHPITTKVARLSPELLEQTRRDIERWIELEEMDRAEGEQALRDLEESCE